MKAPILDKKSTGLLLIDVQERLYPHLERPCELLSSIQQVIKGFQILKLPIFVSEQYPQGLGTTLPAIKQLLPADQQFLTKTSFSCLGDEQIKKQLLDTNIFHWVLVGIEAHVCVLQTAKALLNEGKNVVVLNNAISSRSIYDLSTAIGELRDAKIRVSTVETVLFELLADSTAAEFKQISALVK